MFDRSTINIESEFLKPLDRDPVEIAGILEDQLKEFALREIISGHPNIYVLERKGFNLFHPYFDQPERVGGLNSVKLLSNSKIIRIRCYSKNVLERENVLVTDAIGEGNEVNATLSIFKKHSPELRISKVYAYLARKEGLDRLSGNFPSIQFKSLKVVASLEDYQEEHNRLFCVYHNRMEPIDGEHPYEIFSVRPTGSDILRDVQSIIQSFYSGEFNIKEDKLLINSKKAFTVNILEPALVLNEFSWYDPEVYEVDRMQFRFKYDPENFQLRVMALSLINYFPDMLSRLPHRAFGNCFENFDVRFCKSFSGCSTHSDQFIATCCPHCIDYNVSLYLLGEFKRILAADPLFGGDNQ